MEERRDDTPATLRLGGQLAVDNATTEASAELARAATSNQLDILVVES